MHLLQKNQIMHKLLQITVQSCKRKCSVRFASNVLFFLFLRKYKTFQCDLNFKAKYTTQKKSIIEDQINLKYFKIILDLEPRGKIHF